MDEMEENLGAPAQPSVVTVVEADAALGQTEKLLREQELEKELSSMMLPQLIEKAKAQKVDTKGDKGTVIRRLLDEALGRRKTAEEILLETAIMTWSMNDMKVYLRDLKKATWGAKRVMTERIMCSIDIDDAVEIIREYRTFLAATTDTIDEQDGVSAEEADSTAVDITVGEEDGEERKRKRVFDKGEDLDEGSTGMEVDGDVIGQPAKNKGETTVCA